MKIKGAIFDMDGTLVDSLMFWEREWKIFGKTFLNKENFTPPDDLDASVRTMTMKECAAAVRAYFSLPVTDEEMLAFFDSGLFDFYRNHTSLKPGAIALLENLKKQGIPMCIASATDGETVRRVAKLYGLDAYMTDIVSCTDPDVMAGKDSPAVYRKALRVLQTKAEETAVFEDSYVAAETAKKLGLKTVGIFDQYNYRQDRLKAASDIYIAEGFQIDQAQIESV